MALIMSELPALVREFASYKLSIQQCSPKTVEEYCLDLRTFFRYIIADRQGISKDSEAFDEIDCSSVDLTLISSVTRPDIYEFFLYVDSVRKNKAASKARKLSAIKAFYKYLTQKRGIIENNPAADIESPKKKKTLPKYLTLEESLDLLNAIKADTTTKTKERDYCIVTLFLNTGVRLSELVGISFPDLDRDLRSVRIVGKGNKERIVYLNDACRAAIAEYLPHRSAQPTKLAGERALFLSSQGKRISVKTVQWLVGKYLDAAGLEYKRFSTHKLRHTAATLMYQSGQVDIRVLKEILGHEQLNTTQIYTHVADEGMEKAVAANPLASVGVKNSVSTSEANDSDAKKAGKPRRSAKRVPD